MKVGKSVAKYKAVGVPASATSFSAQARRFTNTPRAAAPQGGIADRVLGTDKAIRGPILTIPEHSSTRA